MLMMLISPRHCCRHMPIRCFDARRRRYAIDCAATCHILRQRRERVSPRGMMPPPARSYFAAAAMLLCCYVQAAIYIRRFMLRCFVVFISPIDDKMRRYGAVCAAMLLYAAERCVARRQHVRRRILFVTTAPCRCFRRATTMSAVTPTLKRAPPITPPTTVRPPPSTPPAARPCDSTTRLVRLFACLLPFFAAFAFCCFLFMLPC